MRTLDPHPAIAGRGPKRPRRPAPKGWLLPELSQLSGKSIRTIRHYLTIGLVPAPAFRGKGTRYGREQLVALLVIDALRRDGVPTLALIKRRKAALTTEELEALAATEARTTATAAALGVPVVSADTPDESAPLTTFADWISEVPTGRPGWKRVAFLPGLQVLVRTDASGVVRDAVRRFAEYCGALESPAVSSASSGVFARVAGNDAAKGTGS